MTRRVSNAVAVFVLVVAAAASAVLCAAADDTNHSVPVLPAPWTLTGRGYVFVNLFAERRNLPASQNVDKAFVGGNNGFMLIDYSSSPAGPYYELLFVPGQFAVNGQKQFRVTQIYVSSLSSLVNGQRNWNIPKKLANFQWVRGRGVDQVSVTLPGQEVPFFNATLRDPLYGLPSWLWIPVASWELPDFTRTLVQPPIQPAAAAAAAVNGTAKAGTEAAPYLKTVLQVNGRAHFASGEFASDGHELPPLSDLRLDSMTGVLVEEATMIFPPASPVYTH